jgi:hypothetical protein
MVRLAPSIAMHDGRPRRATSKFMARCRARRSKDFAVIDEHGRRRLLILTAGFMATTVFPGAVPDAGAGMEIEGRPLVDFLQWAAARTGRRLVLADAGARRQVATIHMHGSIRGLTVFEALSAVMASTSLHFEMSPAALRISSAEI